MGNRTLTHLRLHDISLFGCMVKHLLIKAQAIEDVYDLAPNPLSPKKVDQKGFLDFLGKLC